MREVVGEVKRALNKPRVREYIMFCKGEVMKE
jgi:hypothetical protein